MNRIVPVILTTPAHEPRLMIARLRDTIGEPYLCVDWRLDGAARNTARAIHRAREMFPGSHILLLEDDVWMHHSAPQSVLTAEFPEDVGVISFCDMREMPQGSPTGLYPCGALGSDGRGWWGNQALLIHSEMVQYLAESDWRASWIENSPGVRTHREAHRDGGSQCSDIRLSLLVNTHPLRRLFAVHVPSVFVHVGRKSRCFPGRTMGERETRNWIGGYPIPYDRLIV
jgi:hypothetical protein